MLTFLKNNRFANRLYDFTQVELSGIPPGQMTRELNRAQMRMLPFFSGSIAILFISYAIIQAIFLQEALTSLLVSVALVSALILFGLQFVTLRVSLPEHLAARLYGLVTSLALFSMLLRLYVTREPKQVANLILFMVAVGALFFSSRWVLGMLILTLGGWLVSVFTIPEFYQDGSFYAALTAAAATTALILHVTRLNMYQRIVILRIREQNQRRELERQKVQLDTSAGVGQHITSILDLERLLPQVAELIRNRYHLHYVGVLLPETDGMKVVAEAGNRHLHSNTHHQLAQQALQNGGPVHIPDLQDAPVDAAQKIDAHSALILLLKMGDKQLGVLDLQSNQSNAFKEDEVPIYQQLADQVAIALENAHLYQQVKQFNQQLERKVQERTQALQDAYAKLERLDRTKTDFITIASHELRTPLTLLNFYAQMFHEDEDIRQNAQYTKWANGIYQGAMRMEDVVSRMLDVAKIDTAALDLYPGPVHLPFLFASVISKFKEPLAERKLTITVEDIAQLPEIEADAEALTKVFYNLIVNGIKYTPDGGWIKINGRSVPQIAPHDPTPGVEITIQDSGIGIPQAAQTLIFDKFYQTGEVMLHSSGKTSFKGGGAGLGLAIARGIVHAHNGRIWATSPGHNEKTCPGSTFHVVLPLSQEVA